MRGAPADLRVGQWSDPSGFNQDDLIRVLDLAFDQEERLFRNREPKAFEQIWCHDRIRNSGLILQTHEDKSLGRSRPLPANDIAGDRYPTAMAGGGEITGSPNIWQLIAQQFHRVRSGRQLHRVVIGLDSLRQSHGRQRAGMVGRRFLVMRKDDPPGGRASARPGSVGRARHFKKVLM